MVDETRNDAVNNILAKLNDDVIPGISKITTEIEVIKANTGHTANTARENTQAIKKLDTIVTGAGGENLGLVARVSSLEKWRDDKIWIERAIVAALVVNSVAVIVFLLKLYFTSL